MLFAKKMIEEPYMKILHVTYTIKEGKRDEFYREVVDLGIASRSRAEEGCLAYDYYFPVGKDNKIFLLEIWKTPEDAEKHMQSAHFAKLQELKKEYVTDVRFGKFLAESI